MKSVSTRRSPLAKREHASEEKEPEMYQKRCFPRRERKRRPRKEGEEVLGRQLHEEKSAIAYSLSEYSVTTHER